MHIVLTEIGDQIEIGWIFLSSFLGNRSLTALEGKFFWFMSIESD